MATLFVISVDIEWTAYSCSIFNKSMNIEENFMLVLNRNKIFSHDILSFFSSFLVYSYPVISLAVMLPITFLGLQKITGSS